jgi:hypothetical protein
MMNVTEVQKHSKMAFDNWRELWEENIRRNKPKVVTKLKDISGCFKGKTAVLFAFGPSFIQNVKNLKESELYRNNPEKMVIGCVDKAFRPLIDLGIQPDFCMNADGSVSVEYLEGVPDEAIKKCFLINNIYGQPDWSDHWAKIAGKSRIYWYLNKDNLMNLKLGSAEIFGPLSGCFEVIEAGSNVGNSLSIFTVKILGCKEIYLCAYNYCWDMKKYYGVDDNDSRATVKKCTIGQVKAVNYKKELVTTSINMEFSAKWLDTWILFCEQSFGVIHYDLSGNTILKEGRKMVCQN